MQPDILRFTEAPISDEGIERYDWYECNPVIGTNLNSAGKIRLTLESQDTFNHPAELSLLFEGRLTKANGEAYDNGDAYM